LPGLGAVFYKELADFLGSRRFLILLVLIALAALSASYTAAQSIREELERSQGFVFLLLFTASSGALPPFISFVGFFGPLAGLALGFDAVNRELSGGMLSRVLSQPVFRDALINGKFLAGLTTIGIMLLAIVLLTAGIGLRMLGVPPNSEEIIRLLLYLLVALVYVAFWLGLALLFSILFRRATTSALSGIGVWLFFTFFMFMIASVAADTLVPLGQQPDPETVIRHENVRRMFLRFSPGTLYQEATLSLLTPTVRSLGPVLIRETSRFLPNPLPLKESILLVWPQLTALVALTLICFAVSYIRFMRQEIRSP